MTSGSERQASGTHLSPAYWGSLIGLAAGIILSVVFSVLSGVPDHARGTEPAFYIALVVVAFCSVRYYIAISVHAYEGYPGAILYWPDGFRTFAFVLLFLLTLTSSLAWGLATGFGISHALVMCLMMAVLSLIIVASTWLGRYTEKGLFHSSYPWVGLGDIALLLLLYLSFRSAPATDRQALTILWLVLTSTVLQMGMEFNLHYKAPLADQLRDLRHRLSVDVQIRWPGRRQDI